MRDAIPAAVYGSANASFDKNLPTSDLTGIQTYERGLWWKVPEPDDDPSDDVATVWISDFFDARLYAYSANPRVEDEADIVSAVDAGSHPGARQPEPDGVLVGRDNVVGGGLPRGEGLCLRVQRVDRHR